MSAGGLTTPQPMPPVAPPAVKTQETKPASNKAKKAGATKSPPPAGKKTEGKRPSGEGQAVRESLSLLQEESLMIDELRIKLATTGSIPNRSELLRAGIRVLSEMKPDDLAQVLERVPKLRPGRPT